MLEITFLQAVILITALWIVYRIAAYTKTKDKKQELKMLLVWVCIIVITRFVYFPLHLVDGHIGHLYFDSGLILPLKYNLRVFFARDYHYRGWAAEIIGNVALFVPVGIIWPYCFEKLNRFWKVFLAGAGYSLLVELSQLLFFTRTTDIDDLLANTLGVILGAALFFIIRKVRNDSGQKHQQTV